MPNHIPPSGSWWIAQMLSSPKVCGPKNRTSIPSVSRKTPPPRVPNHTAPERSSKMAETSMRASRSSSVNGTGRPPRIGTAPVSVPAQMVPPGLS